MFICEQKDVQYAVNTSPLLFFLRLICILIFQDLPTPFSLILCQFYSFCSFPTSHPYINTSIPQGASETSILQEKSKIGILVVEHQSHKTDLT